MDDHHPLQHVLDLVDSVWAALSPKLRCHLPTTRASDLEESCAGFHVVVVDPQRWTMMSCPDSVDDGRVAAGRELVELVVQPLVDDVLGPQTFQLVRELFDACRDLFWQLSPG